jgi:hypothetical protein
MYVYWIYVYNQTTYAEIFTVVATNFDVFGDEMIRVP